MKTNATPFQTLRILAGRIDKSAITLSPTVHVGWVSLFYKSLGVVSIVVLIGLCLLSFSVINIPFFAAHQTQKMIDNIPSMPLDDIKAVGKKTVIEKFLQDAQKIKASSQNGHKVQKDELLSHFQTVIQDNPDFNPKSLTVAVTAPPLLKKNTTAILQKMGVRVVSKPCSPCFILGRSSEKSNEWVLNVDEKMSKEASEKLSLLMTAHMYFAVQDALPKEKISYSSEPSIKIAPNQILPSIHSVANYTFHVFVNIVAVFFWWILIFSGSFIGYLWDLKRSRGAMEFLILTKQPIWVLYGSGIITVVMSVMGIMTLALCLAAGWGLPVHWGLMAGLWVTAPFAITFVSMWSILTTVMFHHEQGRMFARLLLSPLPFCVVWSIRAGLIWIAYKTTMPVQAWESFHNVQSLWPLLFLAPVALGAMIFILFHAINWRLGFRREGLRKIV